MLIFSCKKYATFLKIYKLIKLIIPLINRFYGAKIFLAYYNNKKKLENLPSVILQRVLFLIALKINFGFNLKTLFAKIYNIKIYYYLLYPGLLIYAKIIWFPVIL